MARQQPSTITIHSLRRGLAEIERLMDATLADSGVTGHVVPTIQSGGRRAVSPTAKCYGWTARGYTGEDGKLQPLWSTKEGEPLTELTLVAEHMNRPTVDICETVIHECVHLAAIARNIKDTSKGGRHNKRFKELAESFGLVVEGLDIEGKPINKAIGYGNTALGPERTEWLALQFQPDESAFDTFRNVLVKPKKPPKPRFDCQQCDEFVYGHDDTHDGRLATNVICGVCMVKMVRHPTE